MLRFLLKFFSDLIGLSLCVILNSASGTVCGRLEDHPCHTCKCNCVTDNWEGFQHSHANTRCGNLVGLLGSSISSGSCSVSNNCTRRSSHVCSVEYPACCGTSQRWRCLGSVIKRSCSSVSLSCCCQCFRDCSVRLFQRNRCSQYVVHSKQGKSVFRPENCNPGDRFQVFSYCHTQRSYCRCHALQQLPSLSASECLLECNCGHVKLRLNLAESLKHCRSHSRASSLKSFLRSLPKLCSCDCRIGSSVSNLCEILFKLVGVFRRILSCCTVRLQCRDCGLSSTLSVDGLDNVALRF